MCKPMSGILTKNGEFWSKVSDSHEAIIREHKLNADGVQGPNILRFEITPPNDDMRVPLDKWNYRVDQDITPPWYDAVKDEARARLALAAWAEARIIWKDTASIDFGMSVWVCGGTVNEVCGGIVNAVCGGTVNEVCGGTVNVVWGGTVNAVCGGIVNAVCGGTVNEVCGGTVNVVWGGTVNAVYGGTVNEVCGGTVCFYRAFSSKLTGTLAVIINRIGGKAKCYVGTEKTRTIKGK